MTEEALDMPLSARGTNRHRLALAVVSIVVTAIVLVLAFARPDPAVPKGQGGQTRLQHEVVSAPIAVRALTETPDDSSRSRTEPRRVRLRVKSDDGVVLPGAIVARYVSASFSVQQDTVLGITGSDGIVDLEEVPANSERLIVGKPGFLSSDVTKPSGGSTYDVILRRGLMIEMRVVDTLGKPMKGVQLLVSQTSAGMAPGNAGLGLAPVSNSRGPLLLGCESTEDGRATVTGMTAGRYMVGLADPTLIMTPESADLVSRIEVPRAELTIVLDDPMIAAWRYVDCKVADTAYQLEAVGGRTGGRIIKAVGERLGATHMVGVSGANRDIPPLRVTALTDDGRQFVHEVAFIPCSSIAQAANISLASSALLGGESGSLTVDCTGAWFPAEDNDLLIERKSDGSGSGSRVEGGFRFLSVKRGVTAQVPAGTYEIKSRLGLTEPMTATVVPGGHSRASARPRSDVALVCVALASTSGRPVYGQGSISRVDGARWGTRIGLAPDKVHKSALSVGTYSLKVQGHGFAPADIMIEIGRDDAMTRKDVVVNVDDS